MPSVVMSTEHDVVQETLLGEALEHVPVGALVLDDTGTYLAANRMACELTGYSREELLQKSPSDLAADPSVVPARLAEVVSGRRRHGSSQLRRKDGELVDVEYRVGATRSGGLPHYLIVFWLREAGET